MDDDGRLYRFDPLDDTGAFLGLTLGQCAILGSGLAAAVIGLTFGVPALLAASPVVTAAVVAFGRFRGRSLRDWAIIAATWSRARNRRGWHATLPLHGLSASAAPVPPCLAGLEIRTIEWRPGQPLGAIADRDAETLTAVIPATGGEFVIHPRAEQDAILTRWAGVLAAFSANASPVVHLGWSDRSYPSGLDEHRRWIDDLGIDQPHEDAAASYRQLLDGAASQSSGHDTVLFVTVARHRLSKRAQHQPDGLDRALVTSTDSLLRALRTASLMAGEPDTPVAVRNRFRTHLGDGPPHAGPIASGAEGPLYIDAEFGHVRTDDCLHRTYWIAGYPGLPQPAGWIEPLLAPGGLSRTLTIYLRPVPATESRRRIERDLVKLESDAQVRDEKGRRIDARHQRATQTLLDREHELVAGHPELAHAALLTVTGTDLATLDEHSEILEQHARQIGLDLRPLDARHDLGWAATLPFGLAPRHGIL